MNLPTKITVVRIILTPLFFVFFLLPEWVLYWFYDSLSEESLFALNIVSVAAVWIFLILAELSDAADGFIARRYHMVTDLGKLMDPFSDVLIRITYFVCFAVSGLMPVWILMVILYRELAQMFVRMLAVKDGTVIPANLWGKMKAILYAVVSIAGLAAESVFRFVPDLDAAVSEYIGTGLTVLFTAAAAVSVASFLTYLIPFLKTHNVS